VWFIDYCGPVENRCPDEHDGVRWVSLESATQLALADVSCLPLVPRALSWLSGRVRLPDVPVLAALYRRLGDRLRRSSTQKPLSPESATYRRRWPASGRARSLDR
jgi:hypothetical protein